MALRDMVIGGLGIAGLMVELDGTFQPKLFYNSECPVQDLASVQSWEVPSFECCCLALVPTAGIPRHMAGTSPPGSPGSLTLAVGSTGLMLMVELMGCERILRLVMWIL